MNESTILGVSIRGWITLILIASCCGLAFIKIPIPDALKELADMALGFYLGQKVHSSLTDSEDKPDGKVS